MFNNLTQRLTGTFRSMLGKNKLTEDNIKDALHEVRIALIEADVALPVVKSFINSVKDKAVGHEVSEALSPAQEFIKLVNSELISVMGQQNETLDLRAAPPAVILLAGLQGAGKTTTAAKLAGFLKNKQKKKVSVVSTDVYRPAAIDQLRTVAGEAGVRWIESTPDEKPVDIAERALADAKRSLDDVLIVDTAGRLHVDEDLMKEIKELNAAVSPVETLFVVDAMTGQDAANTAKAFSEALPLTGVILTKADGDERGGAALSVRAVSGKPIKFIGTGEKLDALEPFYPDRIASRILGMGDVLSLIEDLEEKVDQEKAQKFANKIKSGRNFDMNDFLSQLEQMKKMGGVGRILDKIPGLSAVPDEVKNRIDDKPFIKIEAMICSMTPKERANPDIIKGPRKVRIAKGAGVNVHDVNVLMTQFKQMQKMVKKFTGGGLRSLFGSIQSLTRMIRH
jgi:signal recognition particle subunit SRP54